jgi:benzoate-CoA ligase family protein
MSGQLGGPVAPFNASAWLVDRQLDAGRGAAIALRGGDAEQSYAVLAAEVNRAANGLRALGVAAGDRILLVVNDELAFPAFFLGGLRIGAVPVPVSTMLRPPELAAIAADCEAATIVVSERYTPYLPTICAGAAAIVAAVVLGDPPWPIAAPEAGVDLVKWRDWQDFSPVAPAPTDASTTGFWLYTSGTTGRPKGAIHRHGDIEAVCRTYARSVLDIGADDVCYSVPKLFFAFGLGNALLFPLSVGATAVLDPEPATPERAARLLEAHRPTLWFSPPGLCAALVDRGVAPSVFASVRATVTAGEAFPAETMRRFTERFGVEVLDGIGSTEALHIFCSNHPGHVRPGTSGTPVAGYDLKLVNDNGSEIIESDSPGALWIRGPSVAAGYWRRPEVTAATFVDGWLCTGDVYSRSVDGYWQFIGRNSDMIKAGGIWVSPVEVENVLLAHPDVLEAAVVAGRNEDGLEAVIAFVVARSGAVVEPVELAAHCRARMAGFKRPRQIHVVAELPRTATGKIQRFALRDELQRDSQGFTSPSASGSALQA